MSDYSYPRNLSHWRSIYTQVLRDHPQCFVDLAHTLGVEDFEDIDLTLPEKLNDLRVEAKDFEDMWEQEKERALAAENDAEHWQKVANVLEQDLQQLRNIIKRNPDWAKEVG